jgi:Tfp pilus assembly protein PilN
VINLLPTDVKQDIRLARRNTKLRRWAGIFIASILGVIVITVLGLFYIHQNINSYSTQVSRTQKELTDQHLEDTQKKVQDISNNLKLVIQVLSREILFSKLIKQIAFAIPKNAVLTSLQISKVQGGIDISAAATDYATATQVQINLQDPANKIFDKADIINLACGKVSSGSSVGSKYPCNVTIRAQFAKTNPYQFITGSTK